MTKRESERLLRTYVLPELKSFVAKGYWLLAVPVGPLLRGFLIASSSFGKELFYLEALVQPLYVPTDYAIGPFGQRLGAWDLAEQREADAMAEVAERIHQEGLPFLRRLEQPSDVAAYAGSDLRPMTPFADEAFAVDDRGRGALVYGGLA